MAKIHFAIKDPLCWWLFLSVVGGLVTGLYGYGG